jgi:hypothetical protein
MQPQPMPPISLTIALFGALCSSLATADPAGDQRLAADLARAGDLQGELVMLQAGDAGFAAIHRPSARDPIRGGVILLHGPWNTVDGVRVIRPLRLGLAEAGWETLSIQLPTAYATESAGSWLARHPALPGRVAAASRWLAGRGQLNQTLLGEGAGSAVALRHLAAGSGREIRGLVMVSATVGAGSPELTTLAGLELPLLEVLAERDHATVRETLAARRQALASNAQADYAVREITGAVAGFPRLHQGLLATVRSWLSAHADGRQIDLR